MAPFYGWGSNVSRLQSHYEKTVYFLPQNPYTLLEVTNNAIIVRQFSHGFHKKTEIRLTRR